MSILKLIASNNYITLNKELIKKLGILEAVMLGELASEFEYWNIRDELDEGGYFFSTIENLEQILGIEKRKQKKVLDHLKEQGIIEIKLKGMPAKRYIKINEKELETLLQTQMDKNGTTRSAETAQQDGQKMTTNNNIINNKYINCNVINNKEELEEIYQQNLSEATRRILNRKRMRC